MKCPLWSGGRVELFARRGHEVLPGSRDGAGDEGTGSDFRSDGETDPVVASGRDRNPENPVSTIASNSCLDSSKIP